MKLELFVVTILVKLIKSCQTVDGEELVCLVDVSLIQHVPACMPQALRTRNSRTYRTC